MINETNNLFFNKVLMDGIQEIVFIIRVGSDYEFYYDFLNRAAMEKTGLTESVIGKSFREVYPAVVANLLYEQYTKVITSLESVTYEETYKPSVGERHYSEITLAPIFNDTKECTYIVALVRDITEKKWGEFELIEYWKKLNESNQRYRSLFNYNPNAIFSLNVKGQIINSNDAVESITGYTTNDVINSNFVSLINYADMNTTIEYFQQGLTGLSVNFQIAMTKKTGENIKLLIAYAPIIVQDEVVGVYAILRDITELDRLAEKNKENEQRFRIIAEHAHDLITLLDSNGKIIYASPSYKAVLGFDPMEYIGQLFFYNVHPDFINILEHTLSRSLLTDQTFKLQLKQKSLTDSWIWTELHGTPVFDDKGQFIHIVVVTRDISLQKEYELNLKHFAYHDSLTELPNRRFFNDRLYLAIDEYHENKDGLAIIMMDIDHFKSINDSMGHDVGDKVLVEFGMRVRNNIRDIDLVARLGGDEFVVLIPSSGSKENVVAIAERIQKAIHKPWIIGKYNIDVTTSMGIAMKLGEVATVSSMLKSADNALYEAKQAGRDSYRIRD